MKNFALIGAAGYIAPRHTDVHYPMPLHMQECLLYLGYKKGDFPVAEKVSNDIRSLTMNPYLKDDEINYIMKKVINVQ